jgi:parallel beta-helix repeat protein
MAVYYVSADASGGGNGSANSPYSSINQALYEANLQPGDEIVVKPGVYNESVYVGVDGSPAGDITIRSEVPGGAIIQPPQNGSNGFTIEGSYITIDGFEITGSLSHGIEATNSHHISITNNISHDNGASGISLVRGEFYLVEGNTTYGNASSNWFSGISVYQNRNITGDTTTEGYRTIIRDNVSYDNVTENGAHTDGNGIIIDDFQSTQTSGYPNYTYPTLVENNLVYDNGGKGIQVTWSDYVTVTGNTAYHNNRDLQNTGTWRGEISNAQSSNNTFTNNIAVADPNIEPNNTAYDNNSYGGYVNQNVVWEGNVSYNGTDGQASVRTDGNNNMPSASNGNILGVDPEFVNAPSDFSLQNGSVAAGKGYQGDSDTGVVTPPPVDNGSDDTPPVVDDNTPPPSNDDSDAGEDPVVDVPPTNDNGGSGDAEKERSFFEETDSRDARSYSDNAGLEVGLQFQADVDGSINSIRIYTGPGSDAETINLWSADGKLIASQAVGNMSGEGWQEISFDTPVQVEAGETYVASYYSPSGTYTATSGYFDGAMDAGPISLDQSAGVYSYGGNSNFPDQSYNATNYWVDVVFNEGEQSQPVDDTPVVDVPPVVETPVEDETPVQDDPIVTLPEENDGTDVADGNPDGGNTTPIEQGSEKIGETGTVTVGQDSADQWHTVRFSEALDDPAVIMSGMTNNDGEPYTVRVRNVTDEGFEFQIDEWDYQDGVRGLETLSWMAVESGTHTLADGRTISAGSVRADERAKNVEFEDGIFDNGPIVLAQATGDRNEEAVNDRISGVSNDGFTLRVEQEEANQGNNLRRDSVDWIAIEQGDDNVLAQSTGTSVDHTESFFDVAGLANLVMLTDMQTFNGNNAATVEICDIDDDLLSLCIAEETSRDAETWHIREEVGYVGLEDGLILGQAFEQDNLIA